MRLKHLELQGYKTFATRTGFAFDSGITAIVGPNGSGKSNIADAIRWVLGEQSYRALRGKRTEDMIFSGSAQRARLGMASAALLLDNSDGWLPIDFVEVTITRRAYRSGENEYLLNGKRVRLRDIFEMLSKSGLARRTYTVIGQGLVDAVLSLRPDDRRALFEEAAGISLYQSKRAEALSRLDETRANLLRVNDIVNEISPRLRRLERQADRAERHAMLTQQLEGLLRTWYGYRWRHEQRNLSRTRDSLIRRGERLERRRQALEALNDEMAALRARQHQLREQLGGWHRESGDLHRQMETVQRDLAVWQERSRLLARQDDELQGELTEFEAQAQGAAERIAAMEKEVDEYQAVLQAEEDLVAEAQSRLDDHERQREELSGRVAQAQSRVFDLAKQASDRQNRLEQISERRAARMEERAEHEAVIAAYQARVAELGEQIEVIAAERARLREQVSEMESARAALDEALEAAQAHQAELRIGLAEAKQAVDHLQSRYDLLSRLREDGEGLRAGVRAVLRAARRKSAAGAGLGGIIGTVARLLYVPEEYEVAIEVALGGHLEDVVVESWPDAQAAIEFLRSGQRGRVTFLPRDTVRPARRLEVPDMAGIIGVGADLVRAQKHLSPVVEMLLGRAIVARDLKAAHKAFELLRGGFQIVTLAGEVLRSSGSVTGGQSRGRAQGQVLAREREWRDLPGTLEGAEAQGRQAQAALDKAYADERRLREERAGLAARLGELEKAWAQTQAQGRELEGEAEQLAQQVNWRQGQVAQLLDQVQTLEAQEATLHEELERLTAEQEAAEGQMEDLQAELGQLRGESLYGRLSEARAEASVARGTWEHRRAGLEALREQADQLQVQVQAKRDRIAALEQERASLLEQIQAQTSKEAVVQGWLAGLSEKIEPAEAEVARLDAERERLEREEATLRAKLREAESSHAQAVLAQSRQEDRLERLRRQIVDDFGLVAMEPTQGMAEQPPLPLGEMVSALPPVDTLPEGLEEEIHQIKAQIRRMGLVNPNAPEEYAEVLDRYTFLTTQATDLEEAARSLREVIAELDEVMRREFLTTFEEVAARFQANFSELFGGGSARLVLSDPEDVSSTGVDIVARPPGKRQQSLALLSGGERSLTAVALIFALLQVNPPPFCILDEVDAMLDEANVTRFRRALKELSARTQFIVITHNRGTIEAADTIYGVSMGDDSVSQVVSLRLEGEHLASDDGSDNGLEGVLKAG